MRHRFRINTHRSTLNKGIASVALFLFAFLFFRMASIEGAARPARDVYLNLQFMHVRSLDVASHLSAANNFLATPAKEKKKKRISRRSYQLFRVSYSKLKRFQERRPGRIKAIVLSRTIYGKKTERKKHHFRHARGVPRRRRKGRRKGRKGRKEERKRKRGGAVWFCVAA